MDDLYHVQVLIDANGQASFRITETSTDSRVATCYTLDNAKFVCRALNLYGQEARHLSING